MSPTPALDFCRKVQTWQESEANKTAGLVVIMPDREEDSLAALLRTFESVGGTRGLEDRARMWLVGYRALENEQRVLTGDQRDELHAITDRIRAERAVSRQQPRIGPWLAGVPRLAIVLIIAIVALGAGLSVASLLIGSSNGSPPPAGPVVAAPQQPAQGPLTSLQQFRADWDVPASAIANAGSPAALVLLQDGLYYPVLWSIPAGDAGWQPDTTGSVSNAAVHAGDADVTDSGGTTYTVSVSQPFVLASNPQAVFRVLQDGTVQTMPQPHAIRVRVRL